MQSAKYASPTYIVMLICVPLKWLAVSFDACDNSHPYVEPQVVMDNW